MNPDGWQPNLVALVCNWCTYAGADMAGTGRRTQAPNVRVVRFLCTGRIDPVIVVKAFEQGADGVHYLDFCKEPRGCSFTAVIFPGDLRHVGDVRKLEGKSVEVHGDVKEYDGGAFRLLELAIRRAKESRLSHQPAQLVQDDGQVHLRRGMDALAAPPRPEAGEGLVEAGSPVSGKSVQSVRPLLRYR